MLSAQATERFSSELIDDENYYIWSAFHIYFNEIYLPYDFDCLVLFLESFQQFVETWESIANCGLLA